ncbi:MAG TPA: DUF4435 domain-containing protein [Phnomibacter sp.]|nr:DUF4435 domain-containing protein [Phnomibacter sp.]
MALIDEIDAEFIANSIIIDTYDGYYVLVEGETDDLFFTKFLNKSLCQIEVCNGKENVKEVLEIINSHLKKKEKTIGIIDKDFDSILAPSIPYPCNLLLTDFHDIEMMCVNSESFEYFSNEYFSKIKLSNFIKEMNISSIKDYLLNLVRPISELRIISQCENLNLAFKQTKEKTKELDFKKFICKDKFTFKGYPLLIETIKTYYNQGVKLDATDIEKKIKALDLTNFSNYDICKGHDFSRVLIIGILKRIGKSSITTLTTEELERSLRLAYTMADFQKTNLKKQLDSINPKIVRIPTAA